MILSRPTSRRRLLAGLLRLALLAGVVPLLAPTCGTMAPGLKTFSRNSIIIPMDVCYQSMSDDLHKDSSGTGYTPFSCPQTKDPGDVIRAYGLVYQLVRNNIAVYWVINPAKTTTTDVDLTVQYNGGPPVLRYDWAAGGISTSAPTSGSKIDYRGGPFVVDGSDFDKAVTVLKTYQATFSAVKLHVANVAFQGNVAKTMAGGWSAGGAAPPKLALLDIGSDGAGNKNAEPVIQGYLTHAGLDTAGAGGTATGTHGQIYDRLVMEDFLPSTPGDWTTTNLYKNGYQILWVPHWAAPSSCSDCTGFSSSTCPCQNKYGASTIAAALATIGSFSSAGHDVFAECAGLGSFEGVFARAGSTASYGTTYGAGGANTQFETNAPTGFWINLWPTYTDSRGRTNDSPTDTSVLRTGFPSPLMQIGDYPFLATSGAIEDYKPSAYKPAVVQLISDGTHPDYDVFSFIPASGGRGTVVYLAGHSYSGTDGSFVVAGSRAVLNTLFNLGASCVESGVSCNTGLLGECAKGVMSCDQNGQPYCKQLNYPQPEVCDGKDNNCNGLVDDGLDQDCYDGPPSTLNVGICRGGVSSCIQRSDGSFGMSACVGEVLPSTEVCDGLDDACSGHVDQTYDNNAKAWVSLSGPCYTGPASSLDPTSGQPRGICKAGVASCQSGVWGACQVCPPSAWQDRNNPVYASCEILPMTQVCEGSGSTTDMTCSGVINCGCVEGATESCYDGPPGSVLGTPLGSPSDLTVCHSGTRTCHNDSWGECSGEQTPLPLDCTSSKDNDCNGIADDLEPACNTCPAPNDPSRVCRIPNIARDPVTGAPEGVCQDGVRSCTAGIMGECSGWILPSPEVCDGKDNNCDGQVDENPDKLCSPNFTCVSGVCVPSQCGVESRCPEGFDCVNGACARGGCGSGAVTCQAGQVCEFGQCLDPCQGITCATGDVCSSGGCTGGGCYLGGCDPGQICQNGSCVADPCGGVACPVGTFCRAGDCVQSCVYVTCPSGQVCGVDGFCEGDPCQGVSCPASQICQNGTCQADACEGKLCGAGQSCVAGACQDDPCTLVKCPVGACSDGQCYPVTHRDTAAASSHSSGGCGCGTGSGSPLAALLLLVLVPLSRRGRARRSLRTAKTGTGRSLGKGAGLGGLALLALLSAEGCSKSSSSVDLSACKATCGEQQCVDLNYDPAHCGRCDTSCAAGERCVDGACGPTTAVAPYLRSVSPSQALHGSLAPVTVTVTGDRFASGATLRAVSLAGTATYDTTLQDSSHLSVQLDLSDVPITELDLRLVNPDHVISNALPFDVVSLAPNLDSVAPTSVTTGTIALLTVSGTDFTDTSLCHVSSDPDVPDTALPTTAVGQGLSCRLDATTLQPGRYKLWVVNDGAVASNSLSFQVVSSSPVLVTLSPSSGQSGAITDITAIGTGFDITSIVYFAWGSSSAAAVPTTYVDATHLLVSQYALQSGSATVTVRNGVAGTPSNSLTFTALANPPVVSNLSVLPTPPYQGDTATLQFQGTNIPTSGVGIVVLPPVGSALSATGVSSTGSLVTGTVSLAGQPEGLYSAYVTYPSGSSSAFQFRVMSNVAVLRSAVPAGGKQGTSPAVVLTAANLHGSGTTHVLFTGPGGTNLSLVPSALTATTATVTVPLAGLNTGVYALALQNPGAAASNQVSFTVLPGQPSITGVSPSCAVQNNTPATITITGTNFALPDAQGNPVSQLMYSVDGQSWTPVSATSITVSGPTQMTVVFDTRSALADTTYLLSVWNPPGPQSSNTATFKVAGSSCP